jgi:hypothetical protein
MGYHGNKWESMEFLWEKMDFNRFIHRETFLSMFLEIFYSQGKKRAVDAKNLMRDEKRTQEENFLKKERQYLGFDVIRKIYT